MHFLIWTILNYILNRIRISPVSFKVNFKFRLYLWFGTPTLLWHRITLGPNLRWILHRLTQRSFSKSRFLWRCFEIIWCTCLQHLPHLFWQFHSCLVKIIILHHQFIIHLILLIKLLHPRTKHNLVFGQLLLHGLGRWIPSFNCLKLFNLIIWVIVIIAGTPKMLLELLLLGLWHAICFDQLFTQLGLLFDFQMLLLSASHLSGLVV